MTNRSLKPPVPESGKNIASLKVSNIIEALHDKALQEASPDKIDAQIMNSALNDASGASVFSGAGAQTISVVPKSNTGRKLDKKAVVGVLRTYVSWFLGPDESKKVTNSTVRDLAEVRLKESISAVPSFKQFLLESSTKKSIAVVLHEAEDRPSSSNENASEEDEDTPQLKTVEPEQPKKSEEEPAEASKDDAEKIDSKKSSDVGYYFNYSLKISEEDKPISRQNTWRGLFKSIINRILDTDIEIQVSGLGTGQTETVSLKSVIDKAKSGLHAFWGNIDHREFISNIQERLEKTYSGFHPVVKLRDKHTLNKELKKTKLSAQDKAKLGKTDYYIWIELSHDDTIEEVMSLKEVANIVNAAFPGGLTKHIIRKIWPKISESDIVYIKNYNEKFNNTQQIRKKYSEVPTVEYLRTQAEKARNANDAWAKIENIMDRKIGNGIDAIVRACDRARECLREWSKFKNQHKSDEDIEKRSSITDKRQIIEYFNDFFKAYKKTFDSTENENYDIMDESATPFSAEYIMSKTRLLMHDVMLQEASESSSEQKDQSFNAGKIQTKIKNVFNDNKKEILKKIKDNSGKNVDVESYNNMVLYVKCDNVKNLENDLSSSFNLENMKSLDIYASHDDKSYVYGIRMQITTTSDVHESAANIKNDIMNILFSKKYLTEPLSEDTEKSMQWSTADIDEKTIDNVLRKYLGEIASDVLTSTLKISDDNISRCVMLPLKTGSSFITSYAFVKLFYADGYDIKEPESSSSSSDDAETTRSHSRGENVGNDVYIVPVKRFNQKDSMFDKKDSSSRYY